MNLEIVQLLSRMGLNVLCVFIVVHAVFLRVYLRTDLAFTFWALNLVTFAVSYMLSTVQVQMGVSLGLFAVFGILRYRTEPMKIRELSYLFLVIGFGILNGVGKLDVAIMIDVMLVALVAVLQLARREDSMSVRYDKLALLRPGQEAALLADLSERLGRNVVRVNVEQLDLMRDNAEITVNFRCR